MIRAGIFKGIPTAAPVIHHKENTTLTPTISVRHDKVSDATREYIEKACEKFGQYYDRIVECEVVVEKQKKGTQVEIVLKVPQQTLTASCVEENLYKAVDAAKERIETQLKKYHDKNVVHR